MSDRKGIGGRPTKYDPKFCETVIEIAETGGWLSEMAEACDVHRSTMDEWAATYPEFSEALSRAKQKSQAWFERTGREAMFADKFNSSLWAKQMSARHPHEYSEKRQVEMSGPDGGPIQTEETSARDKLSSAIANLSTGAGEGESDCEPDGSTG